MTGYIVVLCKTSIWIYSLNKLEMSLELGRVARDKERPGNLSHRGRDLGMVSPPKKRMWTEDRRGQRHNVGEFPPLMSRWRKSCHADYTGAVRKARRE